MQKQLTECFIFALFAVNGISAAHRKQEEQQLRMKENSDHRGAFQNRVFKLLFLRISYHVFSPHSPPCLLDAPYFSTTA